MRTSYLISYRLVIEHIFFWGNDTALHVRKHTCINIFFNLNSRKYYAISIIASLSSNHQQNVSANYWFLILYNWQKCSQLTEYLPENPAPNTRLWYLGCLSNTKLLSGVIWNISKHRIVANLYRSYCNTIMYHMQATGYIKLYIIVLKSTATSTKDMSYVLC